MREPGVEKAIRRAGSASALARELGVTPAAVIQWERVPSERVGKVSAITGIPLHELRPDLFGQDAA